MRLMNAMKRDGEMAVRLMSEKAQKGYAETDPMEVFQTDEKVYAIKDSDGIHKGMTFEDVQEYLEGCVFEEEDLLVPCNDRQTRTYEAYDGFFVDIVTIGKEQQAWLYHKDYGYKNLMFAAEVNLVDFVEMVTASLESYIEDEKERMEEA